MKPLTREDVAAALDRAAKVIEEDGWTQGCMFGENDTVCAMGAIVRATSGSMLAYVPTSAASSLLWSYLNTVGVVSDANAERYAITGISQWNDMPNRTAADVINAMEKAAVWARERA